MRMGIVRFSVLTTLGSLAWNLLLVGAGYQLGANWEDVTAAVEQYSFVIRIAAVLAVAALGWWVWRRLTAGRGSTPTPDAP